MTTYRIPTHGMLVRTIELDMGNLPIHSKVFQFSDIAILANTHLVAQIAWEAPTGKQLDEMEMDAIDVKMGAVADGVAQIYLRGLEGPLAGRFRVSYIIG